MKKVLLASLLSSLFAVPAFAAPVGGYIAADVQSWSTTNNAPFGNPAIGLSIGGGYRFMPYLGVEANYAQSGSTSSIFGGSYKVNSTQLAVVGTYPIGQFDILAKLGVASNKLALTNLICIGTCSKTSLMYGVGGQYNINQNIGIRLQYLNLGDTTSFTFGSQIAASTISAGVVYTF